MAVKIARQPNKIALLGAPTSAAALSPGYEGAPSALRAAGLIERLRSIGYEVADLGDDPVQVYRPDEESPRARNLSGVLATLESLKPRVEQAVKSNSLPLILSGDCSVALATIAGMRRYFRSISLIYLDRDADLRTPANTATGSVDGMVVSHLTGRGAAELVRFWGEPPLVREPDLALFGVDRIDPSEEEVLLRFPIRRFLAVDVLRKGPAKAAREAIDRVHAGGQQFVLHLDVDVISNFQATDNPGTGGLALEQVREALAIFSTQVHLAAIEVTGYNPVKDADGRGAKLIIDLLAEALGARLAALRPESGDLASAPAVNAAPPAPVSPVPEQPLPDANREKAGVSTGEAWSSESIESDFTPAEGVVNSSESATSPDESDS